MGVGDDEPGAGGRTDGARAWWSTWGLVCSASLMSIGLGAYEIGPASVTPVIRESLAIGPSAAGFIVGVMFGVAVVGSIPIGAILDRTDSRIALAVAVSALVLAGVWGWVAGQAGAYVSLIASRVIGGLAYAVVWNAGIDIISRATAAERRATAVGVFTASGPIGFAIGQGVSPVIAGRFGWPAIFVVFPVLAAVGLVAFWPVSRGLGRSSGGTPTLGEFGATLRNRDVWLVGVLGFLGYSIYLFVNSWGSSYLTEVIGLSLSTSGLLIAVFPAVGILARMSSGILSDRMFGGRRRPVLLGSFLVAGPVVLAFPLLETVPVLAACLFVAGFAVQLTLGLSFAYVRELVDPSVAATAVAFLTSVGLSGAFIAPIAGGAIIDTAGYDAAFFIAGVAGLLGIGVAWRAPEPVR